MADMALWYGLVFSVFLLVTFLALGWLCCRRFSFCCCYEWCNHKWPSPQYKDEVSCFSSDWACKALAPQ